MPSGCATIQWHVCLKNRQSHEAPDFCRQYLHRAQSFNRQLAKVAADMTRQAGAEVTLLELSSLDIPLYNADLEACGTPPDVIRLKEIMSSSASLRML